MKRLMALLVLAVCAPLPAAAQETTLSAVVFVPRNTTFGEIFVRFVEETNKQGKQSSEPFHRPLLIGN